MNNMSLSPRQQERLYRQKQARKKRKQVKRGRELIQSQAAFKLVHQGFESLSAALALTLGPARGAILSDMGGGTLEFLTNSGTIARRVIQLPVPGENVGVMLVRSMVQDVHERYGDGAATANVLARAMLREAARYMAAGMNPAQMRVGIERAVEVAKKALAAQAEPISDQEDLSRLATGVTGDPEMGAVLGEMFDMLGEHATVITEEVHKPGYDRSYIKGGLWDAVPASRIFIPEGTSGMELYNPLIAIVDETLEKASQVQAILEQAVATQEKAPLLLIAREFKEEALTMLTTNHVRGVLTIGAMTLASALTLVSEDYIDIATLTGASVVGSMLGRSPSQMKIAYFGRARRATLTRTGLTIVEGAGDQTHVKQRIAEIRAQMSRIPRAHGDWETLNVRVGRLAGGLGVLKIGAFTEQERELKRELSQKVMRVLEQARVDGVVPGGGVAYLNCIDEVKSIKKEGQNLEEQCGVELVAKALEAPFCQIVRNQRTIYPPVALQEARERGRGYGFDVLTGRYINMSESGIVDSLSVTRGALEAAASVAIMAMTTDAIVLL